MITDSYIYIPMAILTYNITPQAKLLYGILYKETYKGQKGYKKTYEHLAMQLDCTTRTIYNLIKELEKNNLITISKTTIEERTIILETEIHPQIRNLKQFYTMIK